MEYILQETDGPEHYLTGEQAQKVIESIQNNKVNFIGVNGILISTFRISRIIPLDIYIDKYAKTTIDMTVTPSVKRFSLPDGKEIVRLLTPESK